MNSPTCFVLDHYSKKVVYQAESLSQAQGFVDARERPSIIAVSAMAYGIEFSYQLCLLDATSGQVVAHGPIVDLFEVPDLIGNLRIVALPVTPRIVKSEVPA